MPSDSKVGTARAPFAGSVVPLPVPGPGSVGSGSGLEAVLSIVTLRWVVELRPAVSVATAISVAVPFGRPVVLSVPEYGAAVLVSTSFCVVPAAMNTSTLATAVLSFASAVYGVFGTTLAPEAGDVMLTVGGVVSAGGVVALFAMVTLSCAVLVAPFVSVATAFRTYAPSAWFLVQNSQVYGATFSVRNSLSFRK